MSTIAISLFCDVTHPDFAGSHNFREHMTYPTNYQSSVAIPLPDDDLIGRVVGDSYDPATALNVVKMFASTKDMSGATAGLVKAVFNAEGIDPRLRQIIILRAAKVLNAPYEWQANVPMSLNNGLTQVEIDAAAADGPVVGIGSDYVLVCRATDEMSKSGTLTDPTLQALKYRFGDVLARKFVVNIAWFNLLSLFQMVATFRLRRPTK
jgi:alkylhydroperoxidase family enzyme